MDSFETVPASVGPRIYNLFPSLFGPVGSWTQQLARIAAMGFDWVYVNPFHYPGFSGSLYATKDPYRLNDLFRDANGDGDEAALAGFFAAAKRHGIRVMMDLVVNHTALDALLASAHPEWYRRDADGELYRPRVTDPENPAQVTLWGDLAELDYDTRAARDGLLAYWSDYLRHYLDLGVAGFRCDAAYKVPSEIWQHLIAAARTLKPETRFFAETVGGPPRAVEALADADFDYLFNSSKWWDFRADWLLDQYERFRAIAPSIAFPESHDTARVAAEAGTNDPERIAAELTFRYLFAACFSSGVLMPAGFEYGFRKRLDVVHTRPSDWEASVRGGGIDISDFIAATNRVKTAIPALNEDGPQRRLSAPDAAVVALLRETGDRADGCALVILNPDRARAHPVDAGRLIAETGGLYDGFTDVTPRAAPVRLEPDTPLVLDPLELRLFRGDRAAVAPPVRRRNARAEQAATRELLERAEHRLTIEDVWPEIDGGRHPVKRIVGDVLDIWSDIFCDGHDVIAARIAHRPAAEPDWRFAPMRHFDNDRWVGRVPLQRNGRHLYTIEAWRDLFATWRRDVLKKRAAGQRVALELIEGRHLVEDAAKSAEPADAAALRSQLDRLDHAPDEEGARSEILLAEALLEIMARAGRRTNLTRYDKILEVTVDRLAARFGAWYELFPRSMSDDGRRHGSFDDVIAHLPYVRDLGFDVLYMPPIHPIGRTNRKGRNNTLTPAPDDPGSPYAIGSAEGGHTAIHPELGTLADFRRLVAAARREGLEIALDFAIQCSPDHPWLKEHPEWFDWRPDGTIKFAENPPKRYEDIVNVHFYREALPAIWFALRDVVLFWAEEGVRIFRVDNPHTKPMPFWEWLIATVHDRYPDVIFLSEAFTRPKVMKKLAKLGFTQSYTYFTWRNTKAELTEYLTELSQSTSREFFRPNFFVNTPDINPPFLQTGGRAAFEIRAALAATLSSLWGMYSGFELCEGTPIAGREEYLNSEKYELKAWDWDRPGNIRAAITKLNRIRRDNPALHDFVNIAFYKAHDDAVLFYGKATPDRDNIIWVAVNLDPHGTRETTIELPLHEIGIGEDEAIEVESLRDGERSQWRGRTQRLRLDPAENPWMIWRVTPHRRP